MCEASFPDPLYNTEPEPGYEGLSWYEICELIDEYHYELWRAEQEMLNAYYNRDDWDF